MVGRNQGLLRGRLAIAAKCWGFNCHCMGGETCLQRLGAQQGLKHLSTLSALALVYTGVQVCRGLLQWIRGRWVGRAISF